MMKSVNIGVIIPAYNEALTIAQVIESVSVYGRVIVIDDGSIDSTAEVAKSVFADIVIHTKNFGYDEALESGFRRAAELGLEYVITVDADGQHNPELIGEFINLLRDEYHLVLGARDKKQRISEFIFGWATLLRWGISDPLCGMKGYRMSLYFKKGSFDSYKSIGTDLAFFALRNHFKCKEVKIVTNSRIDGKPRFGQGIKANMRILRSMLLGMFYFSIK